MRITKLYTTGRWFQRAWGYFFFFNIIFSNPFDQKVWWIVPITLLSLLINFYFGPFIDLKTIYLRRKLKPGDVIIRKCIRKKNMNWSYEDPYLVMTKGYILSLKHYELIKRFKRWGSIGVVKTLEKNEKNQLEKIIGEESWLVTGKAIPNMLLPFTIRTKNEKIRNELKKLLKELL